MPTFRDYETVLRGILAPGSTSVEKAVAAGATAITYGLLAVGAALQRLAEAVEAKG